MNELSRYMRQLIFAILIFFVFSCNVSNSDSKNNKLENSVVQDEKTRNDSSELNVTSQIEKFAFSEFKSSIDSFLVDFTGVTTTYQLTIDTINENFQREILVDTVLLKYLVINSDKLIHYSFDDEKTIENLDFRIIEIQFVDSIQCQNVFETLDRYANTKSAIDSFKYMPCLTYQNDRLLKGTQKIFWLDNSCRFSFTMHEEYLRKFRSTLINFDPLDSIVCECGDVTSRK